MEIQFKRILVLAPHTDDAELGCGGSIARFAESGTEVYVVAFSTAEASLPPGAPADTLKNEYFAAMPKLGVPKGNLFVHQFPVRRLSYFRQEVLEEIIKLRKQLAPELVIIPSENDLHQDHAVVHAEGMRAFKDSTVLAYELPWNHIEFGAQAFIRLKKHHLEKKWEALNEYKTQLQLQRPYFTKEFIEGLARVRGTQVKEDWAEAFEIKRFKI